MSSRSNTSQTPSPHRFLDSSKPTSSTPRPPHPSLRLPAGQGSSSQQFASTPRFTFSSNQKPQGQDVSSATQYSSPITRRSRLPTLPKASGEEIEETSSGHDDLPTHQGRKPKRLRYEPPEDTVLISSDPPSPTTPPTTPPHPSVELLDNEPLPIHTSPPSHQHPRFLLSTPNPNQHASIHPSATTITPHPPIILPPRSPTPPPPTPSAFYSPSRRGQKYVPGGIAATVRDWVIETAQSARHVVRRDRHGHRQEVWDRKIKVMESRQADIGAGMSLVRSEGGEEAIRWMLVGRGRGDGEVPGAKFIGVKEPIWDLEIAGEKWNVAVEWQVLDG
ncbi:MAG: hypothetical protein Q9163_003901 [Psora crenata]